MSVDELLLAAEKLNVSIDYFTDPFRLEGEGEFSWRSNGVKHDELKDLEARAGRWIALFRTLTERLDVQRPLLRHSLRLSKHSSFDDASRVGERFWANFELSDIPAKQLREIMERRLNYLVLVVDMGQHISGAACRVADLDIVLLARHDVARRRNFTLAHELFHMLTWDSIPPSHVEETAEKKRNRVEALGDNFAAALLMPSEVLKRYGSWTKLSTKQLIGKLNVIATELGVTAQALKWRLVNIDSLDYRVAKSIPDRSLRNNGQSTNNEEVPAMFSKGFMEVIGRAIDDGHISVRRTVTLLDINIEDLQELFEVHGVECDIDL